MTGVKKTTRGGKVTILRQIKKKKDPTKVLTDQKKMIRSFNKRKDTLLEKVQDIYTATSAQVSLTVRAPASGIVYEYSSPNFKKVPTIETSMSCASPSASSSAPASPTLPSSPSTSSAHPTSASSPTFKEVSTQTTESTLGGDSADESCCRICGESLSESKLWVGCEVKDCSFWRHAWCMGVTAFRKNALKN